MKVPFSFFFGVFPGLYFFYFLFGPFFNWSMRQLVVLMTIDEWGVLLLYCYCSLYIQNDNMYIC